MSENINHEVTSKCKHPPEVQNEKNGISKEGIEEAEQQETREQTRDTLSKPNYLDTTIINLMRILMLPLFIILLLLLLVCGDVELNPGPTLDELMITVCVYMSIHVQCEYTPDVECMRTCIHDCIR